MRRPRDARRRARWPWLLVGAGVLVALVPFSRLGGGPQVRDVQHGSATGALRAGAAVAEIADPLPVPAVGYGLVRPEVGRVSAPLAARALVVTSGQERVGIVTLDLLLADAGLVEEIRQRAALLGFRALWVAATHTHASAGGFAWNAVAQVAATGRYRPEVRRRIADAAVEALSRASGTLQPVEAFAGQVEVPKLTGSRDEFPEVDRRLTRVDLRGAAGPLAQLVVFAAHPTLVPRPPAGLDPDWPGRLAAAEERAGHGVTLVLQGSVGNVSVSRESGEEPSPEAFAARVAGALGAVPLQPVGVGLAHARLSVSLPGPDASRLVPPGLGTLVDNVALWPWAPGWGEIALLRIGSLRLLGVPAETTAASGAVLESASGGGRVVSLVDGYLGYVEPAERVAQGAGESRRQLFGPGLLDALRFGTEAARAALGPGQ